MPFEIHDEPTTRSGGGPGSNGFAQGNFAQGGSGFAQGNNGASRGNEFGRGGYKPPTSVVQPVKNPNFPSSPTGQIRPDKGRRSFTPPSELLPVLGITAVVIVLILALWVFQDVITYYLHMVFSWVVQILVTVILVIIVIRIIARLLFGGR